LARRNPGIRKCRECGIALLTAAEISRMTDVPHSTVALRIEKAGLEPAHPKLGARQLWYAPLALAVVLKAER
jgi:hypothetical protein